MTDPTDRDLVRRVKRGEREAFDTLVRRYLRPALAVAWEFTESLDDAEDVVQDAFHRALRAIGSFEETRPFRPWFFTIVRNAGRNAAARRSRWRSEPVSESLLTDDTALSEIERWEIRKRVTDAMELLTPMQQSCLRLCDLEEFTAPEVAEMIGINESTVRVHLFRARRTLRDVLSPLREESGS